MLVKIKAVRVCARRGTSLGRRAEFRAALCRGGSTLQAGVRPARPHGGTRASRLLSGERHADSASATAPRSRRGPTR